MRYFLLTIFSFLLIATAGAPQAMALQLPNNTSADTMPGCAPEFWDIQQNGARGLVAEQMIPAWEIINPPSSVNALGCFDQSMVASAKAGAIFSDTMPSSTPTFNPAVSIGLGSFLNGPYGAGTTSTLLSNLQSVVDPVLNNLLSNMLGGLTSAIGSTLTSTFSGLVGGLTAGIPGLSGIMSSLMGQNMDCNVMQDTWDNQIVGQGLDTGYSFIPYDNLISRSNLPASLGAAALAQIAANAGVFDQIKSDRENLRTPGYYSFTPLVPTLGQNATIQQIISAF